MAKKKGPRPAPLEPKVVKKLLDKLSTDNEFRRLFKKDAHAALSKVGYKVPAGAASVGACMQMTSTDRIAPKANIIRDREKLSENLAALPFSFNFMCPRELSA